MDFDKWKKIFDEVGNVENLDKNNIIEKIKEKLQVVDLDIYQEWEEKDFNVNYLFYVSSTTDEKQSLLYIANKLGHNKMADFLVEALIKNNANFQLIYDSHKDHSIELLSNQRVVDGLNSINHDMLKTICKYNDKFSYKGIERLLSDKEIVVNIPEDLKEIIVAILDGNDSERSLLELLRSRKAHESSDSKEDVDFSDYEESDDYASDSEENEDHYNLNYEEMETSSENQNAVMNTTPAKIDNKKSENQNDCKEMEISSENQNGCEEIVEQQSSINDEKWQFPYDKFSLKESTKLLENQDGKRLRLCKEIASSDLTRLEVYRLIVRQFFIDDEKLQHMLKRFSSEEIIELLKNQEVVDNIINCKDKDLECVLDKSTKVSKYLSFFDSERSKLLIKKFAFEDIDTLMEGQGDAKEISVAGKIGVIDIFTHNITYINLDKLKLIFSIKGPNSIKSLLTNRGICENINLIRFERFKLILSNDKFDGSSITRLLINRGICENINLICSERFKLILSRFSTENIIKLLNNKNVNENINCISHKRFELIFSSDKLHDTSIIRSLTDKNIAANIELITDEELFEYILENDQFSYLRNSKVAKLINSISLEKSKIILSSDKSNYINIERLIKNQNTTSCIKLINFERFKLIFKKLSLNHIMEVLEDQDLSRQINLIEEELFKYIFENDKLSSENIIRLVKNLELAKRISSIPPEKYKIILDNYKFKEDDEGIIKLLKNKDTVENIKWIGEKLLEYIFENDKFSSENITELLENQSLFGRVKSIGYEKSDLILRNYSFKNTIKLLKNENAVKYFKSVSYQKLNEVILNIRGVDLVNMFKDSIPHAKSTLRFAIALRTDNEVQKISIDYLNDRELIHKNIIKYIPEKLRINIQYPFPGIGIDVKDLPQRLDMDIEPFISLPNFKTYTECEEPLSKLYNLALEKVIKNINPHKRVLSHL